MVGWNGFTCCQKLGGQECSVGRRVLTVPLKDVTVVEGIKMPAMEKLSDMEGESSSMVSEGVFLLFVE